LPRYQALQKKSQIKSQTIQKNQYQENQNITDIMHNLIKKANLSDLQTLNDLKSNKIDTEQTMICVDILHKQITHLIVLLIETMKTIVF